MKTNILLLVVIGMLFIPFTSIAVEETPVTLTAEPLNFSVLVPTELPVTIKPNGETIVPSELPVIKNESVGPVKITNIQVEGIGVWVIKDYDRDVDSEVIGSKSIGMIINTYKTDDTGQLRYDALNPIVINGFSSVEFSYNLTIGKRFTGIEDGTKLARVIFTVGWDNM